MFLNYLKKLNNWVLFLLIMGTLTVHAKRDRTINGIVVNMDGQPMEGAMVVIDGQIQVFTDEAGHFTATFRSKEPSEVIAFLKNYKVDAWYSNPDNGSVKVVLTKGNVMAGRVIDEKGKPLVHTHVALQGFETERDLVTDNYGYFRLLLPDEASLHNTFTFKIHSRLHSSSHYIFNPGIGFYTLTFSGIEQAEKKKPIHIQHLKLMHSDHTPIASTTVTIDNEKYVTNQHGEITLSEKVPRNTQFHLNGYKVIRSDMDMEEEKLLLVVETHQEKLSQAATDSMASFRNGISDIDKDFENILKNLQNEKNLVNNNNELLTDEVEKIQNRLGKGEKLSNLNKEKLQDYLAKIQESIVDIHNDEEGAFHLRNDELIFKLQTLLLEKDSLNKITQARLARSETEKAKAEQVYKRKLFQFTLVGIFLLVLCIIGYVTVIKIRKQKQQLALTNKELEESKADLLLKKAEIDQLFHEQTDSIRTALVIQNAILPPESLIKTHIPNHFIFYKPKDIVSGDFYWFDVKDGAAYIAAVDCTGHGVAGGFTSMLGYSLLNLALQNQENPSPAHILDKLNEGVIRSLRQGTEDSQSKDGMDITLCKLRTDSYKIEVAGGGNPVYIVRNGEVLQFKTDKFAIGIPKLRKDIPKFSNFEIDIQSGDMLYIFSDGYPDQMGGEEGTQKFMYQRFRELLLEISNEPLEFQKNRLNDVITNWIGPWEQIDDITVIGIKIS